MISGTRILAFLNLIAALVNDALQLGDPAITLYVKYISIIITALAAAVVAAIQLGVIPELNRLSKRRRT